MKSLTIFLVAALFSYTPAFADEADIILVSFTAEWCPNCKVLDPKMDAALEQFGQTQVRHVVLDMTDGESRASSFDKVDGTVFAEVYGDYLGLTGIGILAAPDSGEKIGCVTREHSVNDIVGIISEARTIVLTEPALSRRTGLGDCPQANTKVAM